MPDTGQNYDGGICYFRISGQSLIKEDYHNSRISDDIDKKLGPVTKISKRNKTVLRKLDDEVMLLNGDVLIYDRFGAIRMVDS